MKIKNKFTGLILCLALSAASLTGCGGEKASEPVRSEAVQDTAKTDKKADTDKKETKAEKKNDKNALKDHKRTDGKYRRRKGRVSFPRRNV